MISKVSFCFTQCVTTAKIVNSSWLLKKYHNPIKYFTHYNFLIFNLHRFDRSSSFVNDCSFNLVIA